MIKKFIFYILIFLECFSQASQSTITKIYGSLIHLEQFVQASTTDPDNQKDLRNLLLANPEQHSFLLDRYKAVALREEKENPFFPNVQRAGDFIQQGDDILFPENIRNIPEYQQFRDLFLKTLRNKIFYGIE